METRFIDELARRLARSVPPSVQGAREDLERNFRGVLSGAIERLDLVTREEFDVQRRVLERTREKLDALEAELARLEAGADGGQDAG